MSTSAAPNPTTEPHGGRPGAQGGTGRPARPPERRPERPGFLASPAATVVLPLTALVILIALWWVLTALLDVPSYVVPSPADVAAKLSEHGPYLLRMTWVTFVETIVGFALAIVIGIPVAMVIARWDTADRMASPLLTALNAVPKVAIAPILVVWMGFGLGPKIVMVVLMAVFPIVLSTVAGLRSTPAELIELSRSLRASDLQEFVRIRFPWALPQIFTGLQTAISLAVVGAVIGEFIGATEGLGFIIVQSGASADTALAFAALVLLALLSVLMYYVLILAERLALPWRPRRDGN